MSNWWILSERTLETRTAPDCNWQGSCQEDYKPSLGAKKPWGPLLWDSWNRAIDPGRLSISADCGGSGQEHCQKIKLVPDGNIPCRQDSQNEWVSQFWWIKIPSGMVWAFLLRPLTVTVRISTKAFQPAGYSWDWQSEHRASHQEKVTAWVCMPKSWSDSGIWSSY